MSDGEFDNYLTLLTKLLRLDSRQRELVASELRAHLEDRLDELLVRGVSRDEAVKLALEEFGDAAGLAAEFGSLSRNRRRRWLMRMTTFSAAAMVLVAAGLAIFWPGRNAGPGIAAVVAQDPNQAQPKPDAAPANEKKPRPLAAMLDERIDAEFEETPLVDALKFIEDSTGLQFYVKRKMLEEAGLNLDIPVTQHLKQVRVSTLLDLMFDELQLTYYEKDDLIIVSTPVEAESHPEVRVYDCRDLLGLPATGGHGLPLSPPGAPPGFGPPSGLLPGGGPPPGAGLPPGVGTPPGLSLPPGGTPSGLSPSSGSQPPRSDSSLPGRPPRAGGVVPRAGGSVPGDIMPQFGGGAAPGAGLGGLQPSAAGAPANGAGGPMGGLGGSMGGGFAPAEPLTAEEKRARSLMNLITTNVNPESWDEMGGPGQISEYHGLIVVTQTVEIHKKIERVLDMLREASGLEVGGTKKVVQYSQ
jgi:hypothetical protein